MKGPWCDAGPAKKKVMEFRALFFFLGIRVLGLGIRDEDFEFRGRIVQKAWAGQTQVTSRL